MSAGHIRQRSPGSWELRYPAPSGADGKRRTATETVRGNKKAAQARLRELMGAVDKGQHVDKSKITVAEFMADRAKLWKVSDLTRERYDLRVKLINRYLGTVPLQKLGTLEVEQWHARAIADGAGRSTIRLAHQLLARALDDAVRHKMVPRNEARDQPAPAAPAGKITLPRDHQLAPMIEALRGTEFYVPGVLTIYCGLRRGETLALRWCDLDLDAATLAVARSVEETKAHGLSDCVGCQACSHGVWSRRMALRMTRSLRMQAVMATLAGRPRPIRR